MKKSTAAYLDKKQGQDIHDSIKRRKDALTHLQSILTEEYDSLVDGRCCELVEEISFLENRARTFPIRNNDGSVELVQCEGTYTRWNDNKEHPYSYVKDGKVHITLRLVLWDINPEYDSKSIRDVKEQVVHIWDMNTPEEKFTPFMDGLRSAVTYVLNNCPEAETLMPADFFHRALTVLDLKKPVTADDYRAALLVKSRLGRWVRR